MRIGEGFSTSHLQGDRDGPGSTSGPGARQAGKVVAARGSQTTAMEANGLGPIGITTSASPGKLTLNIEAASGRDAVVSANVSGLVLDPSARRTVTSKVVPMIGGRAVIEFARDELPEPGRSADYKAYFSHGGELAAGHLAGRGVSWRTPDNRPNNNYMVIPAEQIAIARS